MYQMGANPIELILAQWLAFLLLPILLYVALVISASIIIKKQLLGYVELYQFRDDCEKNTFYPISIFGIGLLSFVIILPVTLILLPFAMYWLVFMVWKTVYLKIIK